MSGKKNNFRDKKDFLFQPAHNRKPGRGKFWKHLGNRKNRRKGNRFNRQMIEERV